MISVIHPSRQRPQKSFHNAVEWLNKAQCEVELIVSIDNDDKTKVEYSKLYAPIANHFLVNNNRSAVDAINKGAEVATGDILLVLSDDFRCPEGWGKRLVELTGGKKYWIAKTPDGIQPWLITMPIMDREYYNRFGYVYFPDYLHLFCDTEVSCVADLTGRRINLDIPFVHDHYSVGKSDKDAVSKKADATWEQGEKLFLERFKNKFYLKDTPGKITDPTYINWAKMKGVTIIQ
jgi:glycosyltransferase involved in cell wall biosynthesis